MALFISMLRKAGGKQRLTSDEEAVSGVRREDKQDQQADHEKIIKRLLVEQQNTTGPAARLTEMINKA